MSRTIRDPIPSERAPWPLRAPPRIIMLTVFTKTKTRETAEVERARQAMARCLAGALGLTLTVSLAPAARRSA